MAVKIIDVDDLDYTLGNNQKDEAIEDFVKEVNMLKQVKDSNAKNIMLIVEAFDLHSQLWIVSDYCSGGSVHTLMKASDQPGLEERYIIPIARELAIALKHVHEAGIIHRDIKCGNVLISEDGKLQLCDFGVAAVIENDVSKRQTIIGTPYWMPPEMHADAPQDYGQEIDCWAYGCTLFEMATGMPPYHQFHPKYLAEVLKAVPRLEDTDKYSPELRDFVAFCLKEKPEDRPTARQIVEHPYIANTEEKYPTSSLRDLIDRYIQWEYKGGQRMSLFNEMGAAAPQLRGQSGGEDHWIFSTTADFNKKYVQRFSRIPDKISEVDFAQQVPKDGSPDRHTSGSPDRRLNPMEAAIQQQKAHRGEMYLERLFNGATYDYDKTKMVDEAQPVSDLPLRNLSDGRAANRETLIDLDTSGLDMPPTFSFDFSDVPTLKANRKSSMPNLGEMDDGDYYNMQGQATKRATKDWKFPGFGAANVDDAKRATKDWKFPSFTAEDADNKKRATKDWKFPSLAHAKKASFDSDNRRTMDWTFSTAQPLPATESDPEVSLITQTIEEEGTMKPPLPRMTTEPPMAAPDMDQPRRLTLDTGVPGDRESRPMIDLDFGNDFQPPMSFEQAQNGLDIMRSISPVSAISATQSMTSMGPFDLDQDQESIPGDSQFPHRRLHSSNSNLSVAERRLSRLKPGKTSFGSHLAPTSRARGASVDSTASSLVDEAVDESIYGKQYNRNMNAKMRDQLRVGLQRSASEVNSHVRTLTDDSYGDADTDGPYTGDGTRRHFGRSTSAMSAMSYDTDSSWHDERRAVQTPTSFPELMPPHPSVMVEGVTPEMMLEEFDKLLDSAQQAFTYTTMVLRNRESELQGDEAVDSANEAGPLDMTSEEEVEIANFS